MTPDIPLACPVCQQIDKAEQCFFFGSGLCKSFNLTSSTIRPYLCNYISQCLPKLLYALIKQQDSSSATGKPEDLHLAFEVGSLDYLVSC